VANRIPDPIKDLEEATSAKVRWQQDRDVVLVLHLEPEPGISEDALEQSTETAVAQDAFDPSTLQDARERIAATIVRRRGQPEFRKKLLEAYGNRCGVTGCDCVDVLEAAHVYPYRGPDTNHVCNGLLLRSDLHTLFDLGLIGIDCENYTIVIADSLRETIYGDLAGKQLRLPANSAHYPNSDLLKRHRKDSRL
jgi:predicted restriction endonuclease